MFRESSVVVSTSGGVEELVSVQGVERGCVW